MVDSKQIPANQCFCLWENYCLGIKTKVWADSRPWEFQEIEKWQISLSVCQWEILHAGILESMQTGLTK